MDRGSAGFGMISPNPGFVAYLLHLLGTLLLVTNAHFLTLYFKTFMALFVASFFLAVVGVILGSIRMFEAKVFGDKESVPTPSLVWAVATFLGPLSQIDWGLFGSWASFDLWSYYLFTLLGGVAAGAWSHLYERWRER